MDKLRALNTFIAIVDQGSLTAAAGVLDSSLPAVVRTLATLESHLGVRLLNRTTRRLSLTEDGRQYLARARRIVADVEDADRLLGEQRGEPGGSLSVAAPVLFGQYHVAPAITRFLQQHPQMRIGLMLLDRVTNLVEEGLDVGVRIGPLHDSTLVARPVGTIRRVVVASPAFLRRHGTPRHPRELSDAPCVRFHGPDGSHWAFRDGHKRLSLTVTGPFECNLAAPMLAACEAGLGFGRCLSYQAAEAIAARRLRVVLAPFEVEPWPVSITYPSARLMPSRARLFVDFLRDELQAALPTLSATLAARRSAPQKVGLRADSADGRAPG
ncbi:LysR family transcriptional regulator [soil metagenome]